MVLRDLPGQRLGSRAWFWFFRNFLLGFSFCAEQPCLARVDDAVVLIHVDDLLYCGSLDYFHGTFLEKVKEQFTVNFAGGHCGNTHQLPQEENSSVGRWNPGDTRDLSWENRGMFRRSVWFSAWTVDTM